MENSVNSQPNLLVVEDEFFLAMEMDEVLQEMGCTIVGPAVRLEQAVELASTKRIDFAILDVNLRDKTSQSVADVLKDRGIPFIFVTGNPNSIDSSHLDVKVLCKPVLWDELRAVLSQFVTLA